MTRDEIVRLARQAGFQTGWINDAAGDPSFPLVQPVGNGCVVELERFAELVETTIRDGARLEGWQAARDQAFNLCHEQWKAHSHEERIDACDDCAVSIRDMQPPAEWGDMGIPISAPAADWPHPDGFAGGLTERSE